MVKINETYLFLDDFRHPYDCMAYMPHRIGNAAADYAQKKWVIVKNYQEFVEWISKNGIPTMISFDHDLADEHYDIGCACGWSNDFPEEFTEKTGLDCAKWLVNFCIENNINKVDFPDFHVHSMNPIGSERIRNYLHDYLTHE